ncbi:MAG: hypothetical protein BWY59_00089 [Verrucomicrobia bacterium ADurb.Bin345]|nr:MAG: hypothetical protein BWY59_00089 [Verrucomicrobia bacterium ADurb.Bin345]
MFYKEVCFLRSQHLVPARGQVFRVHRRVRLAPQLLENLPDPGIENTVAGAPKQQQVGGVFLNRVAERADLLIELPLVVFEVADPLAPVVDMRLAESQRQDQVGPILCPGRVADLRQNGSGRIGGPGRHPVEQALAFLQRLGGECPARERFEKQLFVHAGGLLAKRIFVHSLRRALALRLVARADHLLQEHQGVPILFLELSVGEYGMDEVRRLHACPDGRLLRRRARGGIEGIFNRLGDQRGGGLEIGEAPQVPQVRECAAELRHARFPGDPADGRIAGQACKVLQQVVGDGLPFEFEVAEPQRLGREFQAEDAPHGVQHGIVGLVKQPLEVGKRYGGQRRVGKALQGRQYLGRVQLPVRQQSHEHVDDILSRRCFHEAPLSRGEEA